MNLPKNSMKSQMEERLRFQTMLADLLEDAERAHLLHVLDQTGWQVRGKGGAAEILGLKYSMLQSRMAKLGIHRPE